MHKTDDWQENWIWKGLSEPIKYFKRLNGWVIRTWSWDSFLMPQLHFIPASGWWLKSQAVWRGPAIDERFVNSPDHLMWSCYNVTVRGASRAVPQMYAKKICLVSGGAPAGHLGGIWGRLGTSGDDLQMPHRCPVDAFSWWGTGRASAGCQGASGNDLQMPLQIRYSTTLPWKSKCFRHCIKCSQV